MTINKMQVTPGGITRTSARAGIVTAVLFLLFGLVFGSVALMETPATESGLRVLTIAFFLIWIFVCISQVVVFRRVLSKPSSDGANSLVDLNVVDSGDEGTVKSDDFSVRLRKLVQLKEDGLITDVEFEEKREQLLGERW